MSRFKPTFVLVALLLTGGFGQSAPRPNVLFIAVDDLRPELGCYGSNVAVTPNIDALAEVGLRFNRAYCQQAICGPSRASLLTGLRPDTCGITHNYVKIRELNPDVVTLPQQFGKHGYDTLAYGKIFHHGDKDPASWNRPPKGKVRRTPGFALPENQKIKEDTRKRMTAKYGPVAKLGLAMGPAYECAEVPDNAYGDGFRTDLAITALQELVAEQGSGTGEAKPFFLALGFNKPHLNWVAPKRYWDLYERETLPMAARSKGPEGGAEMGLHPSFELRVRSGIPKTGEIPPEMARTLKHAYLACVSYVDAQIGRMIAALDEAGVRDNTIIMVWSDHGYYLGEMGLWCKATNYELGTRVPLILWTPDMPAATRGQSSEALVELIDMYPTLCDLAGIAQPGHVEGTSFKPVLADPAREWKSAAFSQFPTPALREWGSFPIRPAMRETYFGPLLEKVEARIKSQMGERWDRELFENDLTGYAMRTDRYRLVSWKDTKHPEAPPLFTELYDHKTDPAETKNIAEQNQELVERLTRQLNAGWKGSLPKEK